MSGCSGQVPRPWHGLSVYSGTEVRIFRQSFGRTERREYCLSAMPSSTTRSPLIYQELDERFPASKFILTVRDEEAWLESCEYLFTEKREEYGFDESRRFEEMHHALYGQNHFDSEVFREAFRRHNKQVKEYFADRPDDLLVIDIAQDDKWTPICSFLEVDPPRETFPHKHSSGMMDRILRKVRKEAGALKRSILGGSA